MITEITLQLADLCKIIICSFLLLWLLFSPSSTGYSSICFLYGDNILVKDHNVPVHLPCDLSPPLLSQSRSAASKKKQKISFLERKLVLISNHSLGFQGCCKWDFVCQQQTKQVCVSVVGKKIKTVYKRYGYVNKWNRDKKWRNEGLRLCHLFNNLPLTRL